MASKPSPARERAATKEERRARSLANLEKNKIKKGEVRNPLGKNGRERSDYVVHILSETDRGQPRILRILMAQYRRALKGSDSAGKILIEHYKGKARQEVDLTSSDRSMSPNRKPTTAEARQEIDRVLAALEKTSGATISDETERETTMEGGGEPATDPKVAK